MTSGFEDREKNYEAKWAHDEDLRFRTISRRNRLLGLWAADQLNLTGPAAESYVNDLLALEVRGARDEDIARKLHEDFTSHHVEVSEHAIHRKMEALLAEAAEQLARERKS
jgi:hypothetical protein